MAEATCGQLLLDARRIAIVGAPGSGKSTLARRLQAVLELPLYHLDDLYWLPGWRRTDVELFAESQRAIAALEEWIIDGNHFATLPIRLARADAICIMDVPTIVALWGFLSRAFRRAVGDRDSLPRAVRLKKNCVWRPGFDPRTLKTLLFFHSATRPKIFELISHASSLRAVVLLDSWRDSLRLANEVARIRGEEVL